MAIEWRDGLSKSHPSYDLYTRSTWSNPDGLGSVVQSALSHHIFPKSETDYISQLDHSFIEWTLMHHQSLDLPRLYSSRFLALYLFSRNFIAPVRCLHALSVIQEAGDAYTHFLARDGYPEYIAAGFFRKALGLSAKIAYTKLSVRMVRKYEEQIDQSGSLKAYLAQSGLDDTTRDHYLVDVGFTGEIPHRLTKIFPDCVFHPRFLISETSPTLIESRPVMGRAKGFVYDGLNHRNWMSNYNNLIITRDSKRSLEDTFGGPWTSATELIISRSGSLKSNANLYPRSDHLLLRQVATLGIIHQAKIILHSLSAGAEISDWLREVPTFSSNLIHSFAFCLDETISKRMLVPHEATNP